ncbi:hypothetical protein DP939_39810 [Spongiactinospora rosea]|uniref:ATP-grasp domain-containing protein n=1 Tax=Spongiactinospora rosea TaxID=2248750 RepID=A0A366LKX5_9ACTN|nr:hypothetical protein [Spongiactinospora rosea]RBQ14585.1 hypothetical protein DP939_39810 [Spongiactinospora rosea]
MSIIVLDRPGRPLLPYPRWLDAAPILLTDRPAPAVDDTGYGGVRFLTGLGFAAAETAVRDLAARGQITAIVAVDPADQVRAGGLRDLLGLPGQSRDAALPLADPVAARALLRRAGVPVVRRAGVRRVCDLYWYAHRWGYPLLVRRRRAPDRPAVAELRDERELRAFAAGRLPVDPALVPDLTVESPVRGARHHGPGIAVTDAALALLPDTPGHPRAVEAVRTAAGDWLVDTVHYDPRGASTRAAVRAQAALSAAAQEAAP